MQNLHIMHAALRDENERSAVGSCNIPWAAVLNQGLLMVVKAMHHPSRIRIGFGESCVATPVIYAVQPHGSPVTPSGLSLVLLGVCPEMWLQAGFSRAMI